MAAIIGTRHFRTIVYACLVASVFASISIRAQESGSKIIVAQTVRQPIALDSRLAPQYHLFVSVLEASGFKVGQTDDPRALDLKVGVDRNPSVANVVASLWHNEMKLFSVRATPGGNESTGRFEPMTQRAAQKFESQLRKIRGSIVIMEDTHQSE